MRPHGIEATVPDVGWQELLERETLAIADSEEQHVDREPHDGLCQSLAGVAAVRSAFPRSLEAGRQPGHTAGADEIVRLLNETIGEVRDLAHGSCPISLNGAGLARGLESLARNIRHTRRASCILAWDSRCSGSCGQTETHLVRIAQEAVHNVFARGRADRIEIRLEYDRGSGLLIIRDNGVGLTEDHRVHDGIGLHTMHHREPWRARHM